MDNKHQPRSARLPPSRPVQTTGGTAGTSLVGLLLALLAVVAVAYWWMGRARRNGEDPSLLAAARNEVHEDRPADLMAAAEKGDAVAAWKLGRLYAEGLVVEENWQQAAEWYRKSAQNGNPDGQFQLGRLFETGRGVPQDSGQAANWYRRAAEQGHADAEWKLGLCYRDGTGVARDPIWAKIWLEKAARQGQAEAQTELERLEMPLAADRAAPSEDDRMAAGQGNAAAQFRMGMRCMDGFGVSRDEAAGLEWYRKAAEQGHAEAQFRLADCLAQGRGAEKNPAAAEIWYKAAAGQGHAPAQLALAQSRLAAGRRAEAMAWLKEAAEGNDAEAQYLLAVCCQKGMGTPKDGALAMKWLEAAAGNGHPKARATLAALQTAKGPDDGLEAKAKQGDRQAQYALGRQLIESGKEKEGLSWVQAASQGGLMEATLWLGWHYQFGMGTGGAAGKLGEKGDFLGQVLSGQ